MERTEETARNLLESIRNEQEALAEKRELLESAFDALDRLREHCPDGPARQALHELENTVKSLRGELVEGWSGRLRRWALSLEELAGKVDGVMDLATLGELSASVAHEIRNPLCGMLLSVEVLQTKMDADDSRSVLLQNLHREAEKMEKVVNNLLHFARHYEPRPSASDMEEVVKRTVESVRSHLKKHEVEVGIRCSALHCRAEIDSDLVQQVFRNILLNAVDAVPRGSRVDVDLLLEGEGERVAVTFTDRGEGIPPESLDRIFDPFFTSKSNGVGLGLSVSKKIVEAHDGRIEVESELGEGTRFSVVFPRRADREGEKVAA